MNKLLISLSLTLIVTASYANQEQDQCIAQISAQCLSKCQTTTEIDCTQRCQEAAVNQCRQAGE